MTQPTSSPTTEAGRTFLNVYVKRDYKPQDSQWTFEQWVVAIEAEARASSPQLDIDHQPEALALLRRWRDTALGDSVSALADLTDETTGFLDEVARLRSLPSEPPQPDIDVEGVLTLIEQCRQDDRGRYLVGPKLLRGIRNGTVSLPSEPPRDPEPQYENINGVTWERVDGRLRLPPRDSETE